MNEDGISERGVEFEGGYQMTGVLDWRWSYQYDHLTFGELELSGQSTQALLV